MKTKTDTNKTQRPLSFIGIKRHARGYTDTASFGIGGRINKPGCFSIVGGLEHCTEVCPATEADRLALIAFLQSKECKEAVKQAEGSK